MLSITAELSRYTARQIGLQRMARNLQVGETVYVPRSKIGLPQEGSSFYRTTVQEVVKRSVRINLRKGKTAKIGTSQVRRNIGILLIKAGDFNTEETLLNPLSKSLLQYFRLLLSDDMVLSQHVRSLHEVEVIWNDVGRLYTHFVIMGHGSEHGIRFGLDDLESASDIAEVFDKSDTDVSSFVSLCCETGYAGFGKNLSRSQSCKNVIAPFHNVHGAVASQFCQTFFSHHLLEGKTQKVAFKHSRDTVPGSTSFRLWQNGVMTAGPKT